MRTFCWLVICSFYNISEKQQHQWKWWLLNFSLNIGHIFGLHLTLHDNQKGQQMLYADKELVTFKNTGVTEVVTPIANPMLL